MNARTLLAGTALAVVTTLPAMAATPIRCSHQLPPQHEVAKVIDRWAAEVETLSNGELDIQLFGANALAKPEENIPSVAKGSFECAFSVNFQWGKTLPAMNVTLRPFAFSDPEIWRDWPDSEPAAYLERLMEEKRLKNIAWLFQTRMSVFTSNDEPLVAPADFQGVKIRGLNPAFDTGLTAMGAATSSMPGSEVYQALSTGVIDAAITDVAAAYARKYYEVQNQMTVTPVISVFFNGYMNQAFYDGLTDAQRAALDEAGRKAAAWAVEDGLAAEEAAPGLLEAEGVALHVATPEENEAIRAVMQPAFDAAFIEEGGEDVTELLKLVDGMVK
ncbi:C4-dicarboxylate ABC transporter [Paracoccus versutus]|uniref:C4-dicarboxylate-binding protein DctP n=1 Tax=Paracoccus versutus TaxID=34007 RepID=A0AAQ0HGX2_PARVE|nr:TRAP transporter substrate-binding protein DctP [Paracoccus versutus]KGJ08603.1 C4-dicarboxylate ABC transporter [Paracoccus versutus]REG45923.1 C4-dicarboxylate-binding protein DctP [Paracoccus versutus]WEJ77634.1 C4-dicarboxylate ABC transporter [Paracoccus versutus]